MGKSGTLKRAQLVNQIQGFRIPYRSDARQNSTSASLPSGWLLLWDCCFAIFKNSQMIYAGNVNVATGKSQTDRVKLNILASSGEVQFLPGERKKSIGLGFGGSVTEVRDS